MRLLLLLVVVNHLVGTQDPVDVVEGLDSIIDPWLALAHAPLMTVSLAIFRSSTDADDSFSLVL